MKYSFTSNTMRSPSTFLLLVSFLHLIFLSTCSNAKSQVRCIEKEKQALLDFKLSFVSPSLPTWTNSSHDCCEWEGVVCNDHTKHVTSLDLSYKGLESSKLRPSLLELQHLTSLNLGGNQFTMRIPEFIGSLSNLTFLDLSLNGFFGEIPPHLGNLSKLQYLNLSSSGFFGEIPPHLGNLSKLQSLDLGYSDGVYTPNLQWLSRLSSITILILNHVNLSNALDWVVTLKMLPDLSTFFCTSCSLPTLPLSSISHINSSTSLQFLDLSNNSVSSAFSYLINGTNDLQGLYLGYMILDRDNLHELLHSLIRRSRYTLRYLFVPANNLNILPFGRIMLPSLTDLDASSNNISGSLPETLPPNLRDLDLSSNHLSGPILDAHLSKFSQLSSLTLSHNNLLAFNISEGWLPPFQLYTLQLRSCKVGPSFPSWILTQKSLFTLDISNSTISDVVPNAFWDYSPFSPWYINLSHNNISGMVPNLNLINRYYDLSEIDLSYNAFHGPIPHFLFGFFILDLSNNKFSSFSPSQPEALDFINTINLSNNNLSGKIPDWIFQFNNLGELNLENNRFSGTLPEAIGSLGQLNTLHLSNNRFTGQLPLSMKNCTQLMILELADNKFSGVVPSWVGESMTQLVALTLRSNNFSGDLPSSLCNLQSLQIFDLSDNKLSGTIPDCLQNFSAMATYKSLSSLNEFENPYVERVDSSSVMWKGKEVDLHVRNLEQRIVINLSGNLLRGEIPTGVTTLKELKSLDLSRNDLNGSIPDKIGNLKSLEFLNLSSNKLCGEIPQSLASLTKLGTLNLSNNNLSGRIPTSTQLETLSASFPYAGNPKLCGEPLPTNCPGDEDDHNKQPLFSDDARDESFDIQAFLAALGMGFAVGLLGVVGILHFNRPCRLAFFQLVNNIADRIFVATHSFQSRIKRSHCFRKANEGAANM